LPESQIGAIGSPNVDYGGESETRDTIISKSNSPITTEQEVERLVMKKYRGGFPKLVAKLEGKYNVEFEIPGMEDNKD
jgi:hypothetical protein